MSLKTLCGYCGPHCVICNTLSDQSISVGARLIWLYIHGYKNCNNGQVPGVFDIAHELHWQSNEVFVALAELTKAGWAWVKGDKFDIIHKSAAKKPANALKSVIAHFDRVPAPLTLARRYNALYVKCVRKKAHLATGDYSIFRGLVKKYGLEENLRLLEKFFQVAEPNERSVQHFRKFMVRLKKFSAKPHES